MHVEGHFEALPPVIPASLDACKLVTTTDLTRSLGVSSPGPGRPDIAGDTHTCQWTLSNGTTVQLLVYPGPPQIPVSHLTPVLGVGDQAGYLLDPSSNTAVLVIQTGSRVVAVRARGGSLPDQATLARLGSVALSRLR